MTLKKKNPKDLSFILGCGGTAKGVGSVLGLGCLTLQNMKKTGPIGGSVDEKNLIPGITTVYFVTEDSVSRLIAELTKMRSDMKKHVKSVRKKASKKLGITIDASKYSPIGHSDDGRKTPRSRAKR